jgi:hypothetical protein
MGRRKTSAETIERAQIEGRPHSLAKANEEAFDALAARAKADTEAMAKVHKIAGAVAELDSFLVEGIAVPLLSMAVEADAVRANDRKGKDEDETSPLVRMRQRWAKRAARDPDSRWRDEIEALRAWRPDCDKLVPRVPHMVGERTTRGEGVHRLPTPDPHLTALARVLKRLTDVEIRVLILCYVDYTGTLAGKTLMSAQTLARGVRGDADVRIDLPTGMVVADVDAVKWPEIVSNADGRVRDDLRDQLRASALTLDERDEIEEQVKEDDAVKQEWRKKALHAHLRFVAGEVAKEVAAARRKLRDLLMAVDLNPDDSRLAKKKPDGDRPDADLFIKPRYLISRFKDDQVQGGKGDEIGDVCYGAVVDRGLRGACEIRQGRIPSATALCGYCKCPKVA